MKLRILNIIGIILIIVAAWLYWRDIKSGREQIKAANIVRMCASTPLSVMGLMLDSTGPASNAYMACSTDVTTNIIANLLRAEPTAFPSGIVEGDEYQIFLLYTNRASAYLRAVRLYNDPSNLYVGVRQPVKFNEDNKPIGWGYTPPALVLGLGTLFNDLSESNLTVLRAQAPKVEAAIRSGKIAQPSQSEKTESTKKPDRTNTTHQTTTPESTRAPEAGITDKSE